MKDHMIIIDDPPDRGIGKTYGLMLIALGEAVKEPARQEVEFLDHWPIDLGNVDGHAANLADICESLMLNMTIHVRGRRIFIVSRHHLSPPNTNTNGECLVTLKR